MKRLFVLVLTAVMLLTMVPVMSSASAAATPTVTVSSAEGYTGSTVRVKVSLSGNPGITVFKFRLGYDSDLLELIDAEFPQLFSSPATGGSLSANPYIVSWFSTRSADENANGVFAILTFRIKEGVKPGTTPLTISYDQVDICDRNLNDVAFATVNGSISMICEHRWDAFGLLCGKCGERKLLGYVQERVSEDPEKRDYRFLVEAPGEVIQSADSLVLTIEFKDAKGNTLQGGPFDQAIEAVYERVRAGNDYYTPKTEGNYLGGLIIHNVPLSAGVKQITLSATFTKGDTKVTYLLGSAKLP